MLPNPWILFIIAQSGKGKSRHTISKEYRAWRNNDLPANKKARTKTLCTGLSRARDKRTRALSSVRAPKHRTRISQFFALEPTQRTSSAEKRSAERRIAEKRSAERRSAEKRSAERRSAERRSAERRSAEKRSAERRSAERRSAERRSAGRRSAEKRSAERRSAERRSAGRRRHEQPIADVDEVNIIANKLRRLPWPTNQTAKSPPEARSASPPTQRKTQSAERRSAERRRVLAENEANIMARFSNRVSRLPWMRKRKVKSPLEARSPAKKKASPAKKQGSPPKRQTRASPLPVKKQGSPPKRQTRAGRHVKTPARFRRS
ncbi:unnamed protein product [Ectocarpus sp. 8 AP-2014]